jgi:DNA polymerase-3 subunit alpha
MAGTIRINDLVRTAKAMGMEAVALTDLGQMFGAWNFHKEAVKEGIKPIIGVETFVAPNGRKTQKPGENPGTIILLAKDIKGYRNLTRLTARANTEGFFHHPRVDLDLLKPHGEGLVALSAGQRGEIPRLVQNGDFALARERARTYARIFPGRFHVELVDNGLPHQKELNAELARLASLLGLPLVCCNECFYLRKSDQSAFEVLKSIRTRLPLAFDGETPLSKEGDKHFKSAEEMESSFAEKYPEALANTVEIAKNTKLDFPTRRFFQAPRPDIGENTKNSEDYSVKLDDFFLKMVREGLEAKFKAMGDRERAGGGEPDQDLMAIYKSRIREETEAIFKAGAAQYILVVADYVNKAKNSGILTGPGKGSAHSSLVCHVLGITDIDPVERGLMFESFLNVEARDFPSIAIEAPSEKVEEIVNYISDTYGGSHFAAHGLEFGYLKGRTLVREVGRIFGLPLKETDDLCGMLPTHSSISIEMALREISLIKDRAKKNPTIGKIIEYCLLLEDLPRHAAANLHSLVVSPRLLRDSIPLFADFNSVCARTPITVVQYDELGVEENGLLCFEVFPQKLLSFQAKVLRAAENAGHPLDLANIPLDDEETFALLTAGNTHGIPFFESRSVRLNEIRNLRFDDLVALRATHPQLADPHKKTATYITHRIMEKPAEAPHPSLDKVLAGTCGFLLYQEQLVECVSVITGESTAKADLLLRKINNANVTREYYELNTLKRVFLSLAEANGHLLSFAFDFWEKILFYAARSPSKSLAVTLALNSYRMAYLKAHHPARFLDALLSSQEMNTLERENALREWRVANIRLVLPPGRT